MMKLICSVAVLLLTLSACGDNARNTAHDKVTLQVSWSISPEHAAFLLGQEEIFPSYGINLELAPSRGSNETLASIEAGRYPFVIASAESLVLARAQGTPARSVLQFYRESPAVVFSIDGSDISQGPQSLVGRKVGIIRTSTVTTQFNFMLTQNNIRASDERTPGTVQTVTATQGGAAQLESGQIDALTQYTNYAPAQFRAQGRNVSELFLKNHGVDTYSAGLIVSDNTLNTDRDLVQRFVCATIESLELAQREPARAIEAYRRWSAANAGAFDAEYTRLSIESTNRLLQAALGNHRIGYHDEPGWQRTLATVRASERRPLANLQPNSLFDAAFVAYATERGRCAALKR